MPEPHAQPPPTTGVRAHLPNALTLARTLLALVVFGLLAVYPGRGSGEPESHRLLLLASAGAFLLAALTDALDGFLARRWNAISRFGRVMDPFADKLLVVGTFVFLAAPNFRVEGAGYQSTGVQAWMVAVVLGRELLVTAIRGVAESEGVKFPATTSGKLKMILQSGVVPSVLVVLALADAGPGTVWRGVIDGAMLATTAVTLLSGVPYVQRGISAARSSGPGS